LETAKKNLKGIFYSRLQALAPRHEDQTWLLVTYARGYQYIEAPKAKDVFKNIKKEKTIPLGHYNKYKYAIPAS
jgi:hypothetical protein